MVIGSAPGGPAALTVWGGQRLRICRTILRTASLSAETVTVEVDGTELRLV